MSIPRSLFPLLLPGLMILVGCGPAADAQSARDKTALAEVEAKLKLLAQPLRKPQAGDWLAEHKEAGQTFAEYLAARPVRKGEQLRTI